MSAHVENIGHEVYVYMNGKLLYKRWKNTGHSLVFDVIPYDKNTLVSIKEKREA